MFFYCYTVLTLMRNMENFKLQSSVSETSRTFGMFKVVIISLLTVG